MDPATTSLKVATVPPHLSFVDTVASHIIAAHKADPAGLLQDTILVPNRRAVRALREAFLRQTKGAATVLPLMRPIGDVDMEELALQGLELDISESTDQLPPAIDAMKRQAMLSNLVSRWGLHTKGDKLSRAQAWRLAAALARFMDQCESAEVAYGALENLVAEEFADHWQVTLNFLKIITEEWPKILVTLGQTNPAEHRRRSLDAMAGLWRERPPKGRVIAAGSTGSMPATRRLLQVVAGMKDGLVILPGLDTDMDDAGWQAVAPSHPQWTLKQLLQDFNLSRSDINILQDSNDDNPDSQTALQERVKLFSHAVVPASVSDIWGSNELDQEAIMSGYQGLQMLVAPGRRAEAASIAMMMRECLETPHKTAALVTADRQLGRYVQAALGQFDIALDDSAGVPLSGTPPARLLRLIVTAVEQKFAPVALLALMQHPLIKAGDRAAYLASVRTLDRKLLRGSKPPPGSSPLRELIGQRQKEGKFSKSAAKHIGAIIDTLEPLEKLFSAGENSFKALLEAHIAVAESLTSSEHLWRGDDGRTLADFLRNLLSNAADFASLGPSEYPAFFDALLVGATVRPTWGQHPRLHIWGPLEARMQRADLMILGGLNEGTWPPESAVDPWMNRPMRAAFGLPDHEQRVGQSAHDFIQAASAPEVILTRSAKVDGSPTVASRWLFRLEAAIGKLPPSAERYLNWSTLADWQASPKPVKPPRAKPPVHARPTKLSVTQVEAWMKDPYGLYARHILGLRKLDPVDDQPSAAQKGTLIHKALELFLIEEGSQKGSVGKARLLAIGRRVFADIINEPAVYAFWWPRFEAIAGWFIGHLEARDGKFSPDGIEAKARAVLPGTDFTLSATADRIDRNIASDAYEIIDYKTGEPPKMPQMKAGFAPQLPLEGWLAEAGAFEDLDAGMVEALVFWKLSGGNEVAKRSEPIKPVDVSTVIEEAISGLTELITQFNQPETPYLSNPRPAHTGYGDYNQLARVKEWQNIPWDNDDINLVSKGDSNDS